MTSHIVTPEQLEWVEYERFKGRHRAALTDAAALRHSRANLIRHEPGAIGPRHIETFQDETFVPIHGTLTLYIGEPPERHVVPVGGIAHIEAGTVQQMVNEGDDELLVFVSGSPPERGAEVLESAV